MAQITVVYKDFEEMKAIARMILKDESPAATPVIMLDSKQVSEAVQEKVKPAVAAPDPEPEKVYTLVDVRGVLSQLNRAGKKDKVQELIKSFGVEKLSLIPEEKYPEVIQKAGEL